MKTYITNDMSVAAFLLMNGRTIVKAEKGAPGQKYVFEFENSDGKVGKYQQKFKVYNRANQSCKRVKCKSFIRRVIISNRSTFFCPDCQK